MLSLCGIEWPLNTSVRAAKDISQERPRAQEVDSVLHTIIGVPPRDTGNRRHFASKISGLCGKSVRDI